ncbi:SCY1 protein kinase [Exophiala aquamarina CBS 119918]|uniref:SCY1 protein kinase n=1 Tax=Exophiala aquamarina CBS 119918 TaxID=1182545 RepID=A0A072P9M6_9EURO|nr:SCY1 protein kinase [Exophiala aquamarina CBS 119918]KEF56467.1 SCY1 protein kinase [Exophiala aquamarina CBS 119918]
MFSSAFKTFSSNISSNYEISKQASSTVGTWTVFDARKKSTGSEASIFVFDRKSLEVSSNGFGARTSSTSIRKAQEEVVERLKKEASSLARLRHPSILQLVEPVEDTRNGGLMFATEPIQCSLSAALAQKDRDSGRSIRGASKHVSDEGNPSRALNDAELDELEIQKGLLQVAKGLEFLHDSAKLVHGNLNPDAIIINAKSDWKISGLAFAGPPDGAEGHQPVPQISLSEVLHNDARIPRSVQLNLDYTSPDFVLDSNINFSADIFSLGLVILACYRQPHRSPVETHSNQSTYKRIFSSASTVPSSANNYFSENSLPRELNATLPRMLTRRPAQRLTANEFQQSDYFDNILVNTMRFLDAFPAKTSAEKSQFMKGLGRVMAQFPPSVLGKKILSVLLDEMKDRELLPLIMQNIFHIIKVIPSRKEVVTDKVLPRMREIFLSKPKSEERDTSKEAALIVVLNNIQIIAENCSAKQFKDDVLPIVFVAMESSTHSLTDAALQTLPVVLPLIDFSTVKHDLFPVVANVFSKTNSLSIKIQGLEALGVLCGASTAIEKSQVDDYSGTVPTETQEKNMSSLDKFTMQEKVIPLLKAIKTKEPAVMMAGLKVLRQIGQVADTEFLALEVMPILWSFSLGPLLDLGQFKAFVEVIKFLSAKVEQEQTRKLGELSSGRSTGSRTAPNAQTSLVNGLNRAVDGSGTEEDFEKLVLGNKSAEKNEIFAGAFSDGQKLTPNAPTFSWSSVGPASTQARPSMPSLQPQPISRSITPDVSIAAFPSLQPAPLSSASAWGASPSPPVAGFQQRQQPLQPTNYFSSPPISSPPPSNSSWQLPPPPGPQSIASNQFRQTIPPPPQKNMQQNPWQQPSYMTATAPSIAGPPSSTNNILQPQNKFSRPPQQSPQKQGLDKYESLL